VVHKHRLEIADEQLEAYETSRSYPHSGLAPARNTVKAVFQRSPSIAYTLDVSAAERLIRAQSAEGAALKFVDYVREHLPLALQTSDELPDEAWSHSYASAPTPDELDGDAALVDSLKSCVRSLPRRTHARPEPRTSIRRTS